MRSRILHIRTVGKFRIEPCEKRFSALACICCRQHKPSGSCSSCKVAHNHLNLTGFSFKTNKYAASSIVINSWFLRIVSFPEPTTLVSCPLTIPSNTTLQNLCRCHSTGRMSKNPDSTFPNVYKMHSKLFHKLCGNYK